MKKLVYGVVDDNLVILPEEVAIAYALDREAILALMTFGEAFRFNPEGINYPPGLDWASMIDATGLVLAARGVGHQDLDRADGIQRGTSAFGPGIFPRPRRGSLRDQPVPVTRGAPLADAVVIGARPWPSPGVYGPPQAAARTTRPTGGTRGRARRACRDDGSCLQRQLGAAVRGRWTPHLGPCDSFPTPRRSPFAGEPSARPSVG